MLSSRNAEFLKSVAFLASGVVGVTAGVAGLFISLLVVDRQWTSAPNEAPWARACYRAREPTQDQVRRARKRTEELRRDYERLKASCESGPDCRELRVMFETDMP